MRMRPRRAPSVIGTQSTTAATTVPAQSGGASAEHDQQRRNRHSHVASLMPSAIMSHPDTYQFRWGWCYALPTTARTAREVAGWTLAMEPTFKTK
jgi:hypothetical protein